MLLGILAFGASSEPSLSPVPASARLPNRSTYFTPSLVVQVTSPSAGIDLHRLARRGRRHEAALLQRDKRLAVVDELLGRAQILAQSGRLAFDVDDLQIIERRFHGVQLLAVELFAFGQRDGRRLLLGAKFLQLDQAPLALGVVEAQVDLAALLQCDAGLAVARVTPERVE